MKYFITKNGVEKEVSETQFASEERGAGFLCKCSKRNCKHVVTAGFGGSNGVRGRVKMEPKDLI